MVQNWCAGYSALISHRTSVENQLVGSVNTGPHESLSTEDGFHNPSLRSGKEIYGPTGHLWGMAILTQILLIAAAVGSLVLSAYSVYQRNYQESVGGLVIAIIALVALLV